MMRSPAVFMLALLIVQPPIQADGNFVPTVYFAFYAPAQKDPPVRIVGFQNDQREAMLLLSNTSDRAVSAVFVGRVDIVPHGCAVESLTEGYSLTRSYSTIGYELFIPPHGTALASKYGIVRMSTPASSGPGYPHLPLAAFYSASRSKASYLQVQFGITAVRFEDGTAWPANLGNFFRDFDAARPSVTDKEKLSKLEHPVPFDLALADAEAGKCANVTAVANALQSVKETVFEPAVPEAHVSNKDNGLPPQLQFTCRLEGPKAICRMPMEKNAVAPASAPQYPSYVQKSPLLPR